MSNFLTLVLTTVIVFIIQQLCLLAKKKLDDKYNKNKKPERKRKG